MYKSTRMFTLALAALLASGCATYVTPAGGVSLDEIADEDLRGYYAAEPAAAFPANITIVRVQDSGYSSRTSRSYGRGRYSVVTTRDIESDEDFQQILGMPMVGGVAPIGRLLLPPNANSLADLRAPAARLRSDLLLVYSVDTSFSVEGKSLGPLSAVSLGFLRNKKAHVTSTVAGALIDVRTGFIYGTTEATAKESQSASVWSTEIVIDSARLTAEEVAFDNFIAEFQRLWKGVVDVYALGPGTDSQRVQVVAHDCCDPE